MKILAIGDVVGIRAVDHLKKHLGAFINREGIDFTVVNGENSNEMRGITSSQADDILSAGADCITLGNHAYSNREVYTYLDDNADCIIRPANYPPVCPGVGYTVKKVGGARILVMNVLGVTFMEALESPFDTVERILKRESGNYDISILDVHAEATSEKIAISRVFDGRIDLIFGTHTHVATADEQILPGGTGYITDLGMTGPDNGIIGCSPEPIIDRMRTHMLTRFSIADGNIKACAIVFDTDKRTIKRCTF